MEQRLVRARRKITSAVIPFRVPPDELLAERLAGVLRVVYLVYTEGHVATHGDQPVRADMCQEAIRLARLLARLMPDEPEALGLLALLLLTDSRRATRRRRDGRPSAWSSRTAAVEPRAIDEGAAARRAPRCAGPAHTRSRRRSPRSTPRRPPGTRPTGRRSPRSTGSWIARRRRGTCEPGSGDRHGRRPARRAPAFLAPLLDDGRLDRYQPLHATHAELLARAGDLSAAAAAYPAGPRAHRQRQRSAVRSSGAGAVRSPASAARRRSAAQRVGRPARMRTRRRRRATPRPRSLRSRARRRR